MKLRLLISLSVALGLVGCSMGHDELEKLCKKDAGTVIYKQVQADGYYSANCKGACYTTVIDKKFKFIEIYNDTDNKHYNPGKGFWRIYLSNDRDSNCYADVTKRQQHLIGEGKCVAFKKLVKPTAKYGYKSDREHSTLQNYYQSKISRAVQIAYILDTEEIIGESISYSLDIDPTTTGDGGGVYCENFNAKKSKPSYLVSEVFNNE